MLNSAQTKTRPNTRYSRWLPTSSYRNRLGEWQTRTEWHRIAYGRLAAQANELLKGAYVEVEGELQSVEIAEQVTGTQPALHSETPRLASAGARDYPPGAHTPARRRES